MKRLVGLFIAMVVFSSVAWTAVSQKSGFARERKSTEICVPRDCKNVIAAIDLVRQSRLTEFNVYISPGFYEGALEITGAEFKGKHIRLVGLTDNVHGIMSNKFDGSPVIYSGKRQTINVEVPGRVKVVVQGLVVINTSPLASAPDLRWQNAAVAAKFGANLWLRSNLIISSHGHGVSMAYVGTSTIVGNTIIAPRIAIADFSNNTSDDKRWCFGNTIIGSQIGYYCDNQLEQVPQNSLKGVRVSYVVFGTFDHDIKDKRLREELKAEIKH